MNKADLISTPRPSSQILAMGISIEILENLCNLGYEITVCYDQIRKTDNLLDIFRNSTNIKELKLIQFPFINSFTDRYFDAVISSEVAEKDEDNWLAEILRLLKPGGWLVINDSSDRERLTQKLKLKGFVVEESETIPLPHDPANSVKCVRPLRTHPGVPSRSILQSERLYMRPWYREDLDLEDEWPDFDNPIYRHYNPPRDPKERRDLRFKKIARLFDLKLSIFNNDELVGYIALFGTDMDKLDSEMGINFAANHCSKGYCKESLRKLCDEFFKHWEMKRMRLEVAVFNEFGIRCYKRCGFRETKRFWNPKAPQRLIYHEGSSEFAHVAKHFRRGREDYEVEFIEMAVTPEEYYRQFHQNNI